MDASNGNCFNLSCIETKKRFCVTSLAIAVGHLSILEKFKDEINDPFTFLEFSRWSPFHFAAANGELSGIMILIEEE